MRVPDKLKLNKFQAVSIPRPIDVVRRLGLHSLPAGEFAGEDNDIPGYISKEEAIEQSNTMYEQYVREQQNTD